MFSVIVTHIDPQEIFASSFSAHIICVTNIRNGPFQLIVPDPPGTGIGLHLATG